MAKFESLIPVDLLALVEDQENSSPIVLLHDRVNNKILPIWIGEPEARAVALALNNVVTPRPLTHRLMLNTIENLNGQITRVVIDRISNNTYYASICVISGGRSINIDSRPSDALVLALFAHVPIFVEKKIMEKAGHKNPFPGFSTQQDRRDLSNDDLKKISELLEKARKREEQESGRGG